MMKLLIKKRILSSLLLGLFLNIYAESGYELWLRYNAIEDPAQKLFVTSLMSDIYLSADVPAINKELHIAAKGFLGLEPGFSDAFSKKTGLIIACSPADVPPEYKQITSKLEKVGTEGYIISTTGKNQIIIAANTSIGALYGTFHLLRIIQSGEQPGTEPLVEFPKITNRLLNHWDNLDRTVERGYAGFSIWDWHTLPGYIDKRYIDYARANASIGINGSVLSNVNANALVLTPAYIEKLKALAEVFRPYGIKVYLTARFSAPIEIGGLKTADPLDADVRKWWTEKVKEIYAAIPDFGGFLVKANSEGQPGPQNYNRSHADGANMLADALAPYGGIVMWRAFVYSSESPEDRAKQANIEFEPLDGKFRKNVVIQVKNGPIDFQPREPFHPLFGAMPKTSLALEIQITQEYLGQGTSLAFLAPLYKECLDSRTYRPDKGSRVADIIDGSVYHRDLSVIAGVSNIGNDINWTGHPFAQANWYAFGRLAWNHEITSEQIAEEWIALTFNNDEKLVNSIKDMMLNSRDIVVSYMTPLGLHHIMGRGHHYGPGPWVTGGRADWTSPYYHKADSIGIGFNRTSSGSNALAQYAEEIRAVYENPKTCPQKYVLWFHHLPWNYIMKSGHTLWEELCYSYDRGVKQMSDLVSEWGKLEEYVDHHRYRQVAQLLSIQEKEAEWWRNACLLYFQQFSMMKFPEDMEQPKGELKKYMEMRFPYAPGIKPSW